MKKLVVLFATVVASLTACKASNPALTGVERKATPVAFAPVKPVLPPFDKEFKFRTSEFTAQQPRYDENQISVLFRVNNGQESVNKLNQRDFRVSENRAAVTNFQISSTANREQEIVDIAFVVDITQSMGPFIEAAKVTLTNFIRSARQQNYHVRMCLSTFGDFVVKKCDRFFDSTSDDQLAELVHELTSIRIVKGQGEIDGHQDINENPMRALTEAAKGQWSGGSKRFMILVTDADFYSPDKPDADKAPGGKAKAFEFHQSRNDTWAPPMAEVTKVIQDSQIQVFAVTPDADGYNRPLGEQPGIVQSSKGGWFLFDLQHHTVSLEPVLKRILNRINTTYTLTYSVEKNNLDPTLSVQNRKVEIVTDKGQVTAEAPKSTKLEGRPQYQQTWKISDQNVQPGSAKVFIDGNMLSANEYTVQGGELKFNRPPAPGANIRAVYLYDDVTKNFRLEPIVVPGNANAQNARVYLNGKLALPGDVSFDPSSSGNTNLNLAPSVFGANERYDIRQNNGLKIKVLPAN
jgi:hypothetical protein